MKIDGEWPKSLEQAWPCTLSDTRPDEVGLLGSGRPDLLGRYAATTLLPIL